MIPKVVHFCFGLSSDPGDRRWSLLNHVCVMSALDRLRPERAVLWFEFEPTGPWWRLTKPHLELARTKAPREVFGNPLLHYAHRADVLRLRLLLEHGGIYLDTDVFVHRPFDDLLGHETVLGLQQESWSDRPSGLCNAVILARSGARFLHRWIEGYRGFSSRGRDATWDEHSVRLPLRLAEANPEEVTVLPHDAFHWPTWIAQDLALLYGPPPEREVRGRYANHLWAQAARRYTRDLTPGQVRSVDSAFHLWARPYLADLPDGYGAPTLSDRAARLLTRVRRRLLRSIRPSADPVR